MNRDFALWTGILAGPIIWLLSFEANFALVPWACEFQAKLALYVVRLIAIVLAASSFALAWRLWKELGKEWPGQAGGALARSRVMAGSGVLMSAMFFVVIVAQSVPELILGACE
jgi:hypothetical protein